MKTTISIKNMVCPRCILSIKDILTRMDIGDNEVSLGRIILLKKLSQEKYTELKKRLEDIGFWILNNKEEIIIENTKKVIRDLINSKESGHINYSALIEEELGINYSKISKVFSSLEGKTIEKFTIELRIEKVKELIWYNELSISEISYELGYSTPQHLSKQFKQVTGFTTSEFKKTGERKELDKI